MPATSPLVPLAEIYARSVADAVRQEYPNSPRNTLDGPQDLQTPRQLHPAFYGCFDWHSAVEMHWALVRLLRLAPDAVPDLVGEVLDEHLTSENLTAETAHFAGGSAWERPYGWGWLLMLAEELDDWTDELDDEAAAADDEPAGDGAAGDGAAGDGAAGDGSAGDGSAPNGRVAGWSAAVHPLAGRLAALLTQWLAKATYPTRDGAHLNSAFGLSRALPWARRHDPVLAQAIDDAARRWFAHDTDYPAHYEPGGADFLSGALTEAELMASVLPDAEFGPWFAAFLPDPSPLYTPAHVSDAADGYITHLHGLNLYRAHALGRLADRLGPAASAARQAHLDASLPAVIGGDWMAEHWLAAYAVLALG